MCWKKNMQALKAVWRQYIVIPAWAQTCTNCKLKCSGLHFRKTGKLFAFGHYYPHIFWYLISVVSDHKHILSGMRTFHIIRCINESQSLQLGIHSYQTGYLKPVWAHGLRPTNDRHFAVPGEELSRSLNLFSMIWMQTDIYTHALPTDWARATVAMQQKFL